MVMVMVVVVQSTWTQYLDCHDWRDERDMEKLERLVSFLAHSSIINLLGYIMLVHLKATEGL